MRRTGRAVACLVAVALLAVGCGDPDAVDGLAATSTAAEDDAADGTETGDERDQRSDADADADTDTDADADTDEPAPPHAPGEAPPAAGILEVHYLDVGQANATLLRHAEATMLIDTGDWQRSDVVPALREIGVQTIDVVAITHPHADHIGQFDQVMAAFEVDEVWWSGAETTTQTFERALDALEASTASYAEPRAGATTELGPLLIEIVGPDEDADFGDVHDSNLSMRITYGQIRFLFTGDAEARTEARMVERWGRLLDADVYEVGHHGSTTSTTPAFLDAVDPTVSIYSAGAGNSFGHPHAEVLDRLDAHRTDVYGTDVHGTVVVTTDGTSFEVQVERAGTPRPGGDRAAAGEGSGGGGFGGDGGSGSGGSGSSGGSTGSGQAAADDTDDPADPGGPAADGCGLGRIDINTAGAQELEGILHIGPARAADIIQLRPFASVESLTRVNGIGAARLADILAEGVACVP